MAEQRTRRFDFESKLDRKWVSSQKWQRFEQSDVLPMWVADMDFAAPPCVQDTLADVVQSRALGYGEPSEGLKEAFINWCQQHYGWCPEREWLVWLPGVVPGVHQAVEAWLKPEDGIAVHTPVYPPLRALAGLRNRPGQLLEMPAPKPGTDWALKAEHLAADLNDQTRAFVLCNPQNPTGRVYSHEELRSIAETARQRDLLVISDEIWADLILDRSLNHIPFASLGEDAAKRSITLMSASKTFNVAGLSCAVAIIPDQKLRDSFRRSRRGLGGEPGYLGLLAADSAWRDGGHWRKALIARLNRNLDIVMDWLSVTPGMVAPRPQATFVVWIDARDSRLGSPAQAFLNGGVALSDGADFGMPGFARLNIGCPEGQLREALHRMSQVLERAGD